MDSTTSATGRDARPPDLSPNGPPAESAAQPSGSASPPSAAPERRQRSRTVFAVAAMLLLVVIVAVALWAWWYESHFVTTDDAFIDTRIVTVSPRVPGQVIAVPVTDNQSVRTGEVLVRIDPTPYRVALQQALAAKLLAKTGLGQARANVAVASAALQQARATYMSAQAQAANAVADLRRYRFLRQRNPKAVARTQMDRVATAARSVGAEARAARQRVVGAEAQLAAAHAALAGASARVASARAAVKAARLNLGYTIVKAAQAGHVTQKSVAVGNYIAPGQELMALVPVDLWVTANFKETDLDVIHPGERAAIHIDACPNADAHGHVQSIQRGSGEAFDLLPPQNATGNYVKVVQRVPVRIMFDSVPRGCVLGPGMSVEPKIRIQ